MEDKQAAVYRQDRPIPRDHRDCYDCQGTNGGHYPDCPKRGICEKHDRRRPCSTCIGAEMAEWHTKEKLRDAKDAVNHPPHYTAHPSGVECITVTEHMNFNVGNAVKYLWRAGNKNNLLEDLKKARWYVDREILRQSTAQN